MGIKNRCIERWRAAFLCGQASLRHWHKHKNRRAFALSVNGRNLCRRCLTHRGVVFDARGDRRGVHHAINAPQTHAARQVIAVAKSACALRWQWLCPLLRCQTLLHLPPRHDGQPISEFVNGLPEFDYAVAGWHGTASEKKLRCHELYGLRLANATAFLCEHWCANVIYRQPRVVSGSHR